MKRLVMFALGLTCASHLGAQGFTNLSLTNNEIAGKVAHLEQYMGPGPFSVTGKLGPGGPGGCRLLILVNNLSNGVSDYEYIDFVDPEKCKNYIVENESQGEIKIVPKNDPGNFQDELSSLRALLRFLSSLGGVAGVNSNVRPSRKPKAAPHPAVGAAPFPKINDLPFAPPFSNGTFVTNQTGCDPNQTYLLFSVNHFDNSVTRFDGCPLSVTATIPMTATRPLQAALTPDNSTLIVTSYDQGITFIDTATNKVTQTLFAGGGVYPSGISIRSDGELAYITSLINSPPAVLVLDVKNRAIVGKITFPVAFPHSVLFSPDGTTALVTFPITNYVYVIDVLTSSISTALQIASPFGVAFDRTGTHAYVSSRGFPTSIKVVDTGSYQVVDSYPINGDPGYVELSPDGRHLSVLDLSSSNVYIIDLLTRNTVTVTTTINGGGLANLPSN